MIRGKVEVIDDLVGKTLIWLAQKNNEEIIMRTDNGVTIKFFHDQDCCENVEIAEVIGDWQDLKGTPIITAEVRSQEGTESYDSSTWTFYTFRTIKGTVDVRWLGESNGCYSEGVTMSVHKEINHS